VQLIANTERAAEFARLMALGVDPIWASLSADEHGEKKRAEAQERAAARLKALQDNIAKNTAPTKKGAGAKKEDEGKKLIQQMKERLELIGKETEYEKLLANISSGALKFRISGQQEQALGLAKALDQKQRELDVEKTLKELREEQGVTQRRFMREIEAFGKGDWANGVVAAISAVEERYQQVIRDRRNSAHGLNDDELKAIQQSLHEELIMVRDHYAQLKQLQGNWRLGASSALENYADQAANLFESVGGLVSNVFKGMEDSLVQFVRTGKLDFASLADSIIADMARIMIQQSITGPLAGAIGNFLGGMGSPDTSYAPDVSGFYSSGGYTGDGGRYEPAGIVHKGEGVLNQDEIRSLGGEAGFNDLRRALRGPGHLLGGLGGRPSLPQSSSTAAAHQMPNVTVNLYGSKEQPRDVKTSMEGGNLRVDVLMGRVKREIAGDIRAGRGDVDAAIKERYGLTKAW
jgi:lambda family phage tail tape measure protein